MQQLHIERVTDALLAASTALVAVAARSIAEVGGEVTLPQFRALVVLSQRDVSMAHLAQELDCSPSAATRLCDRLVRKQLVTRETAAESRREVRITITQAGRQLVDEVLRRRRAEIHRIVPLAPTTCSSSCMPLRRASMSDSRVTVARPGVVPSRPARRRHVPSRRG